MTTGTLQIRKIAVLGAGVMGAQIAAHLVNADVETVLFDLPSKDGDKSAIAKKAIQGLADEGFLDQRQGSGNFVSTRIDKNFAKLTSFSEDMRARGRTPRSEWIKRSTGTVTPEEAMKLALSPGSTVYRFHRLRYADDAPMALEYATLSAAALPSLESVDHSLYDALEKAGNRPVRALQRLRALLLNEEQARLLGAKVGDAGLLVERLGYLRDGRAVELSQSIYRGDTYDFVAELNAS